ncbi:hypothetical protein [Asanoa siamensis]|uniref:Uncharacterized protein n=1 Tax=Asanoa siamensis TaxID=926357 RepID=A0ABQ4CTV5_9ACTN|nr:hypothetical protein [Asanoa siamensis]GIF74728.1 hypothetical protein Asi02nite_42460 [Asanoa siamensis]
MASGDRGTAAGAQVSADRLALALEDVGFDVGQEFSTLHDTVGRHGLAVVRLGDIGPATADRLALVLSRAAERGITLAEEADR